MSKRSIEEVVRKNEERIRNNRALILLLFFLVGTNYFVWQNDDISSFLKSSFKKDPVPITRDSFSWKLTKLPRFEDHEEPVTLVTLNELGTKYDAGHYDGTCEVVNGTNYQYLKGELAGIVCTSLGTTTEIAVIKEFGMTRSLEQGFVRRGDKTKWRAIDNVDDFDILFEVK
jgi:hypothetical protein